MDDFSDTPRTLGEARADRSTNASDWKPRDALVRVLRQIDSGELAVEEVVICYRTDKGSGYWNATSAPVVAIGMLAMAQMAIGQSVL